MNNVGTMIGVNGGPMPESPVTGSTTLNIGGPNGRLTNVNSGAVDGVWYDKDEPVKPRVYHKYYKGCKNKDDKEPENPDTEDNTGSNTEQEPIEPPIFSGTVEEEIPLNGGIIVDSEED